MKKAQGSEVTNVRNFTKIVLFGKGKMNTKYKFMNSSSKVLLRSTVLLVMLLILVSCNAVNDYSNDDSSGNLDITAPEGIQAQINGGSSSTNNRFVVVTLSANDNVGVSNYALSEDGKYTQGSSIAWIGVEQTADASFDVPFKLSETGGDKTVYAWFKDNENNISMRIFDSITLAAGYDDTEDPVARSITINSGNSQTSSVFVSVALSATDNSNVTACYLSEDTTVPLANQAGWVSVDASTDYSETVSFTLSSTEETKNIYVWFRDTAGNMSSMISDDIELVTVSTDISVPFNTSVVINNNDPDTTSLMADMGLNAEDDEGVTAYYLSESPSIPVSDAAGWTSIASAVSFSETIGFILSSGAGNKTVYAWFKDAAGNVSDATNDEIEYVINDTTAPDNTTLVINNGDTSTNSLLLDLAFSATDNYGVTHYYLSEDGTTPSIGDLGWTPVDSSTDYSGNAEYTATAGHGTKTIYVFFRDDSENISLTTSASILFEVIPVIIAGDYHTCAISNDGQKKCWGRNSWGQLGFSDVTSDHMLPVDVTGIDDITQLAGGYFHTCALTRTSTVKCWGRNNWSQLGLGYIDSNARISPTEISESVMGGPTRQVFTGAYHSCATLENNTVRCWGYNNYGQLGIGINSTQLSPTTVFGLSNVKELPYNTGRSYHTCAVKNDGDMQCWGLNNYGQLGIGNNTVQYSPVDVDTTSDVVSAAISYYHTCAVISDGGVKCWGRNNYGQLGNNDAGHTNQNSPVDVFGISNIVQVAVGYYHSCALLDTGSVKCWGMNNYGQLGTNNNTSSDFPVDVLNISTAIQITAGTYHTCAVLEDGDMQCWGYGGAGQLGIGDNISANSPVSVDF